MILKAFIWFVLVASVLAGGWNVMTHSWLQLVLMVATAALMVLNLWRLKEAGL